MGPGPQSLTVYTYNPADREEIERLRAEIERLKSQIEVICEDCGAILTINMGENDDTRGNASERDRSA